MPRLTRRTHILFDDAQHDRLERLARERDSSLGALVREAVERTFPPEPTSESRMRAAAEVLRLAEEHPLPAIDWDEEKHRIRDEMLKVDRYDD